MLPAESPFGPPTAFRLRKTAFLLASPMSHPANGESAPASQPSAPAPAPHAKPKYPGFRVTCNGNYLVTQYVETRITEGGVFYPITPSTEGGEIYQQSFAQGELNVWGHQKVAVETEGEIGRAHV